MSDNVSKQIYLLENIENMIPVGDDSNHHLLPLHRGIDPCFELLNVGVNCVHIQEALTVGVDVPGR